MAILVATVKVKDPEKFQQYAASVPATMEPFGGKLLGRGKVEKGIDGDVSFHAVAMFGFPDAEALDHWHHSAEYRKNSSFAFGSCLYKNTCDASY